MISGSPFSFTLIVMSMMLNVTNFTENLLSLLSKTLSLACSFIFLYNQIFIFSSKISLVFCQRHFHWHAPSYPRLLSSALLQVVIIYVVRNVEQHKVNRCLARYSPRATTTNRPTNRALNKPAWPGPN